MNKVQKIMSISFKVLASIMFFFYLLLFLDEVVHPDPGIIGLIGAYALFCFFILGYVLLWKNERISALIFIVWYGFLLILANWVWTNAGMVIGFGFPIFVLGVLILVYSYWEKIKSLFY